MIADQSLKVKKETKEKLESIKIHPRETVDDLLNRLLRIYDELTALDIIYQDTEDMEGLGNAVEKIKRIYKDLGKL